MAEETVFTELIKELEPFDRKLLVVLDKLRAKQDSLTIHTSRFALCRMLRLGYSDENAKRIETALDRLVQTPLYLPGPESGFVLATKAIAHFNWEKESEKLIVSLGKLFLL